METTIFLKFVWQAVIDHQLIESSTLQRPQRCLACASGLMPGPLSLGPGRPVKPLSLQHVRDVQHRLSAPTAFQKVPGLSSLEILAGGLLPPMCC